MQKLMVNNFFFQENKIIQEIIEEKLFKSKILNEIRVV